MHATIESMAHDEVGAADPAPRAQAKYSCAACGAPVHMVGVSVRRECEHVTSGILASMTATVYGESKVK